MSYILETLPYPYNGLEPIIDETTVRIHHDKHHQGYTNNINKLLEGSEWENKSIEEVLTNLDKFPNDKKTAVKNNAGGYYNHNLYWEIMIPGGSKEPVGNLKKAIEDTFGSFDEFKKQFEAMGASRFGSGWVSLAKKDGKICVMNNPNQDSPLSDGYIVIINNDVWEHAYYLKYQNRRGDYLKAWWELVNWDIAEKRFNS